jgi:diguanylate cyclase (GGDEF)-like protein
MAQEKRFEAWEESSDEVAPSRTLTRSGVVPRLWEDDEITEITATTRLFCAPPRASTRFGLTVMTGAGAGQIVSLVDNAQVHIGRSRGADLRLDATGVSRMHCRIIRRDDAYWIEDLGSTNGTVVNGANVRTAKLDIGDRIQIGPDVVLQFRVFDEAEESLARKLFAASTTDALTGAFNRRYFSERLEEEVAFARRHGSSLSLVLVDIDLLKAVNQTHGSEGGDAVIRSVSAALRETMRTEEATFRYASDQLAILVREPMDGAVRLAERIRGAIESLRIATGKKIVRVTVSVGVAATGERGAQLSTDGLVRLAERRCVRAKELGRNRVVSQ